jgi:pentapeptide repeat protein
VLNLRSLARTFRLSRPLAPDLGGRSARGRRRDDGADRDLRARDFLGADLEGADLRGADLRHCDLRGADLLGARLEGADLRGARMDMTRIVEIEVPETLALEVVNQIRDYDFRRVMTRLVPPGPGGTLPCPYRHSALRPLLFEWGSRTWRGGRDWSPPTAPWNLEEIIAAVLDELGCRHDLRRPIRSRSQLRPQRTASPSGLAREQAVELSRDR